MRSNILQCLLQDGLHYRQQVVEHAYVHMYTGLLPNTYITQMVTTNYLLFTTLLISLIFLTQ